MRKTLKFDLFQVNSNNNNNNNNNNQDMQNNKNINVSSSIFPVYNVVQWKSRVEKKRFVAKKVNILRTLQLIFKEKKIAYENMIIE